jgi:hypothetical protein
MTPIEVTVAPQADDGEFYEASWPDGDTMVRGIHEKFLDLIPFMLARQLLEWGYNVERELIVRLQGADYELMRAPLGAVAATPLVNRERPVKGPTRFMRLRQTP